MANPIPEHPPVTIATLSCTKFILSRFNFEKIKASISQLLSHQYDFALSDCACYKESNVNITIIGMFII